MPRTGSTLLLASLGTHPAIAIRDEIFHRLRSERAGNHAIRRAEGSTTFFDETQDDAIDFLGREVFAAAPPGVAAIGFKLHADHVRCPGTARLPARLAAIPRFAAIHLVRPNHLEVLVSLRVAQATGAWRRDAGTTAPRPELPRLVIDPAEAFGFFAAMAAADRDLAEAFGGGAYLRVTYDALATSFEATLATVTGFLGVPPAPVAPPVERQITVPLPEIVGNYDALRAASVGTPWARFFLAKAASRPTDAA